MVSFQWLWSLTEFLTDQSGMGMQRCAGDLKEGWILQQFFFPRQSPSSADISGEKGKCYIWGSDGDLGWLSAKHCYRQSMYIFLLNPHNKLLREIFTVHYPEGESKV